MILNINLIHWSYRFRTELKRAAECSDRVDALEAKFTDYKSDSSVKINMIEKDTAYFKNEISLAKNNIEALTDKTGDEYRSQTVKIDTMATKINAIESSVGDKVESFEETVNRDFKREIGTPNHSILTIITA